MLQLKFLKKSSIWGKCAIWAVFGPKLWNFDIETMLVYELDTEYLNFRLN